MFDSERYVGVCTRLAMGDGCMQGHAKAISIGAPHARGRGRDGRSIIGGTIAMLISAMAQSKHFLLCHVINISCAVELLSSSMILAFFVTPTYTLLLLY